MGLRPAALLVGLAAIGATAHSQQPTFRAEANYVRVDVYPTANGVPVLDLAKEDFEIFDNNQPQVIDAFERVTIRAQVPQESRREPTTVAESRAMLENPRARVFVLFLDFYHVDVAGSNNMRRELITSLDRALDPDDLIGVMTPEMSARDVSFARKTATIAGMLEKHWTWGERDQIVTRDPEDLQYRACYGTNPEIAEEMIERRHETLTLNALQDLVRYLRAAREERKAILAISAGWRLFRPNPNLMRPLDPRLAPGVPFVGVDPRSGRPAAGTTRDSQSTSIYECDRDRMNLAQIDDEQAFRDIVEEANRANASFYPVDPRGLVAFDEPIVKPGGVRPPPPSVDAARLRARNESLRALAADTDGLAIVQTNNLAGGLNRIVSDLSSYYLLGYYSTTRLDGRFHSIRVRVKRPGVQVRARRGYLAPSAEEITAAATRGARPTAPLDAAALEARAVEAALAPLDSFARERPLRLHAVAGWRAGGAAAIWAVGEFSSAPEWKGGAEVDVMLRKGADTLVTTHVQLPPGVRSFRTMLAPRGRPLDAGDYGVSVRARGRAPDSMPSTASIVVPVRPQPAAAGAVLVRRGPTTGNKEVATADVRFRRTEQVRVEVPDAFGDGFTARLLDRAGKPLPVPVSTAVRADEEETAWSTAQLTLAPLAPGDYVIELAGARGRTLVAFRMIP